jgi:serpin B
MRPVILATLALALAGCGRSTPPPDPGPPPPPWSDDMQAVADGSNRFALDLYGKLRGEPGNLFLSPYSVHAALAMTADGANGPTRDEMVKVLHLPPDPAKALAAGDLGRYYAAGGTGYELSVANALWGQKGFPWRPEFLTRQRDRFGKEGVIKSNTTMVLTNAIYFKGQWAEQFDKKQTRDAPFRLADGKTVTVPLMHRSSTYRYGWFDGVQVVELPYKGGDLSMVVVLPEKPDGLPAVEKQLTADQLAKWLAGLRKIEHFDVSLPRFKITWGSALLNEQLKALGMAAAFDGARADFTGMATAPPGWIDAVVHKAFVDVNEEGTEAAAATAVDIASSDPGEFRADRPFLFLIRDVKRGTILFLGRLTDPSK